jgi:hypothetical protein
MDERFLACQSCMGGASETAHASAKTEQRAREVIVSFALSTSSATQEEGNKGGKMGGDKKTTRRQFLSFSVGKMLALSYSGKLFRMFENEVNASPLSAARTRICIVKSYQVCSGLQIDQKVLRLMRGLSP